MGNQAPVAHLGPDGSIDCLGGQCPDAAASTPMKGFAACLRCFPSVWVLGVMMTDSKRLKTTSITPIPGGESPIVGLIWVVLPQGWVALA
jgi:hypothetical protein